MVNSISPDSMLKHGGASDNQIQEALQMLSDINRKLKEIETELYSPEHCPSHLGSILKIPEQYLWLKSVSYKLSRLGIWLKPSSKEPANEFMVAEFEVGQYLKPVLLWIRVA
jgi:hypothetical protein